jgi:hypothetical protein
MGFLSRLTTRALYPVELRSMRQSERKGNGKGGREERGKGMALTI